MSIRKIKFNGQTKLKNIIKINLEIFRYTLALLPLPVIKAP